MLNHKLHKIRTVNSVQWRRNIKHYFVVVFFKGKHVVYWYCNKTYVIYNNASYYTIIFKLLIVQSHTIILSSLQKTRHNWNLIYEIFNSYILFKCFTEKLVFLRKGSSLRRHRGGIPKPKNLWTISHELVAFKICHKYNVLVSLAKYCCGFSIPPGLCPCSRHMVFTWIKLCKTLKHVPE